VRVRSDLPSGTVTFLFTDIEGSTRLLHELGNRYVEVLAEHRRALREAFASHGGAEVDTQGDAFFVAFARASDALAAADAAQRALADGPILVRMGLHTGEPVATEEGYVGMDVHKAARICAAGHGRQIVLSEQTARLLDGVALRDLGLHRLKDLTAPERLYQLGDADHPPLKTLYQTNLPVQATPLIGREREVDEAGALLRSHRLLTLTGAGGSGKTRLALQLAAEAAEDFPDGVFWVPLQALRDPALVEPSIAASLGAETTLARHVGDKRLLVLLDNFEQVVEAAPAVAALLAATPNAKVLVTSREPLHLESEQQYPVEPLPEDDAVVLFVERARALVPAFEPTPAVAEICRRLDNLPLAVELAAARVALLSPDELLARLERRLPLLGSRSRELPERQRTLRAAIGWSYDLLGAEEQELLRRLAVFAPSGTLEAVESVCDADVGTVESLVLKNLVRRWETGRLGMLETIREYALERLDESGEADEIRARHARYYLTVAEPANLAADSEGQQRHALVAPERDNMRAALSWTVEHDRELGLRLLVALENWWATRAPEEGRGWAAALLDDAADVPDELRAAGLRVQGGMSNVLGNVDVADSLWAESLRLFRALSDDLHVAILLHRFAMTAAVRGDWPRSRALAEESLAMHRRSGFSRGETQALTALATVARAEGDPEGALELLEESARLAEATGFPWWLGGVQANIAAILFDLGRMSEARTHARQALSVSYSISDRPGILYELSLLAEIDASTGSTRRAGLLLGAVEAETARTPPGRWLFARTEPERVLAHADPEFELGRAEGRMLPLDEAVARALEGDVD
jgi:predicted ATPase/class 3 adenylate cyclase